MFHKVLFPVDVKYDEGGDKRVWEKKVDIKQISIELNNVDALNKRNSNKSLQL
jgi:hypothetical protein